MRGMFIARKDTGGMLWGGGEHRVIVRRRTRCFWKEATSGQVIETLTSSDAAQRLEELRGAWDVWGSRAGGSGMWSDRQV